VQIIQISGKVLGREIKAPGVLAPLGYLAQSGRLMKGGLFFALRLFADAQGFQLGGQQLQQGGFSATVFPAGLVNATRGVFSNRGRDRG
jgi:hypothetical protein